MRGGTLFSGIGAPEAKSCAACRMEKSMDAFPRQGKRGRHSYCRECYNARYRGVRRRKSDPADRRRHNLMTRYRITPAEYDALLAKQNGKCALCSGDMARPVTDHDHATGAVRGILCQPCNIRLGGWDDREWRANALRYLGIAL